MDIDDHDTFEIILSRLQRNHPHIICLKNSCETLIFKEADMNDKFSRLKFIDYYYLRRPGTLPVYNFIDGNETYQFFGCEKIKKYIPEDILLLEEYPLLLNYTVVCEGENNFYQEYSCKDHYVHIRKLLKIEITPS